MQCPCGNETITAAHTVKTLAKAIEWYPLTDKSDLPITVDQEKCSACGRAYVQIINNINERIATRG